MKNLAIVLSLFPFVAAIVVMIAFGNSLDNNVARFEHLTKKLVGYPVSRITLEFPQLTPKEQQHVVERLDSLLSGSARVISHRLAVPYRKSIHVDKDTVPAYFQWQEGRRLLIVTGQPFPPNKARWLRQLFARGLEEGEQDLPQESTVDISGSVEGQLRLTPRLSSLDSFEQRWPDRTDVICVLAVPIARTSPIIPKLAASRFSNQRPEAVARFSSEMKLSRADYPVASIEYGGGRTPRLLLAVSQHTAECVHREKSYRLVQCGPQAMASLEPMWQALLAKQALAELALPRITRFAFEESVTFSPWYAEGEFRPAPAGEKTSGRYPRPAWWESATACSDCWEQPRTLPRGYCPRPGRVLDPHEPDSS